MQPSITGAASESQAAFVIGGGECGALVRAIDWAPTVLGPPSTWPQSFRTSLDICLSSRFPIALYWGPTFAMLYNDALTPMVGVDTSVALSVSDNGKGISAEFLPYIFERFRQADGSTTRRYGGLGLGLALARHLVEAHGGTIRAESGGEGTGATFTVMLPVQAVYAPDRHSDRPSQPSVEPLSGVVSLAGVTALIIDDEPDARELVSTVLEASGAAVIAASSAKQALELLASEAIDVLISDVGMPDVDGYGLSRRVRALSGKVANTPAIALTAYARELDRNRALQVGFQAHVAKPVEPTALLRAVAELLAARKS